MSPKDRRIPENQQSNPSGVNGRNMKRLIYLVTAIMIFTAVGASAVTVIVLQRLGFIAGNLSPSPSPTELPASPTNSVSPIVTETPSVSPSESVTPAIPVSTAIPTSTISATPILQSSLLNTDCQSATPGWRVENILKKVDESGSVGGEVLPILVDIGGYNRYIEAGQPLEAVCNLNGSFTELNLVYGVNSGNRYAFKDNKLVFRVDLDNKTVEAKEVIVGEKYTSNLNLQGVKNVKLRVECLKKYCPPLSIAQMSLK
ncbi:hypothetical protein B4U84_19440 [Westiellopsis prolifica IICB1]|nr:hypothetical protein B4U84_19440 [Westiellopsis prolifica IICB1]